MAHSIESRTPFLDYELVEFAVRAPASMKLRDGWTKWILRSALEGSLPEPIRSRKSKLGFDTPQGKWLRLGLENGQRRMCEPAELRLARFLSAHSLSREFRRFLGQKPGALPAEALFRALSLELWAKVHEVN